MKILLEIYAEATETIEVPDCELEGMSQDDIEDYIYENYTNNFVDNNIQISVDILG